MIKTRPLTTALSVALLALVAGCSPSQTSKATSVSVQSGSTQPSLNNTETAIKLDTPGNNNTPVNKILPPDNPDPAINAKVEQYINKLAAEGFAKERQGVWIQSGQTLLANYQGTVPLPAASVTKAATSLAVLQTFGPDRQFVTLIGATGAIKNGVLQGDLVVVGGEDPMFIWEEAIVIGNILNQIGIKRVTGNLAIAGKFYMNFESNPQTAGNLFKQGLNNKIWPAEAEQQYLVLPPDTPRPEVEIAGSVKLMPSAPDNVQPLVRHLSLPLAEIVKKMNMYSNNMIAQALADAVGGGKVVAQKAASAAGVPQAEIQLINGSGLGEENRISPRAACAIFQAIELYLQPYNLTLGNVFAIAGQDLGVLNGRQIPTFSVVKTGTLDKVSSLAGAMPTKKLGSVWIAIINGGTNQEGFRKQQDAFLNSLVSQWGAVQSPPPQLKPSPVRNSKSSGNEIVK